MVVSRSWSYHSVHFAAVGKYNEKRSGFFAAAPDQA
jgi:hypothetical protein